jgi:Mg/Co/Ni transporter MgtE
LKKNFIWIIIIGIILIAIAISLGYVTSLTPKATPSDFQSTNFSSNSKLIAQELILYNETEIKDYPLTDLPSEEIKAVFSILDSGNLSKVLLNVPQENIKEIKNKLSDEEFGNILNRLPNETGNIIKEYIKK